jgi:hypothetical protein
MLEMEAEPQKVKTYGKVRYVRFEVLASAVMKSIVFWGIKPCRTLRVN